MDKEKKLIDGYELLRKIKKDADNQQDFGTKMLMYQFVGFLAKYVEEAKEES